MAGFGRNEISARLAAGRAQPIRSQTTGAIAGKSLPPPLLTATSALQDGKGFLLLVIGVAVLAGGGAAAALALFPARAPAAAAVAAAPAPVAQPMPADYPDAAKALELVKQTYRDKYGWETKRIAAALARNDVRTATQLFIGLTNAIGNHDGRIAAHADGASLTEFLTSEVDIMVALRRHSSDLCAKGATSSLSSRDVPEDKDLLEAEARQAIAAVRMIESGRGSATAYGEPTREDTKTVAQAVMMAGLSRSDAMAYDGAGSLKHLSPDKACDIGIKAFRALAVLPEPTRSRVLSKIVIDTTKKFYGGG